MPYLLGFIIALFIALTGVGAGTITVPVLMLFLGVPAPVAVGIGLTFSAVVKLILAPAQIASRNVSWSTLTCMLLGGVPGILIGSLVLHHFVRSGSGSLLDTLLGVVLIATASWQILFFFRPRKELAAGRKRNLLLAVLMVPVGAEVGFSSAGAGALGSAALLAFTPLGAAQVVGTDIVFGAILSLLGALAQGFSPSLNQPLLLPMIAGGLLGAVCGLLLSSRVPRRAMRLALWVWILVLGGQLAIHGYSMRGTKKVKTNLALTTANHTFQSIR